jgi:ketosteroid isomerase-like protein
MNRSVVQFYRVFAAVGAIWFALGAVNGQSNETGSDNERALREVDRKWSEAAAAKDVDKVVSYYAENAIVLPPNAAIARTRETVRTIWKEMLESPGLVISWTPEKVEVAKSGELGYVSGTYQLRMNDAKGKPVDDRGKYLEVMKKQADGSWKCVADTWNSDLPAAPPDEEE